LSSRKLALFERVVSYRINQCRKVCVRVLLWPLFLLNLAISLGFPTCNGFIHGGILVVVSVLYYYHSFNNSCIPELMDMKDNDRLHFVDEINRLCFNVDLDQLENTDLCNLSDAFGSVTRVKRRAAACHDMSKTD